MDDSITYFSKINQIFALPTDISPFSVGPFYLRTFFILLVEGYLLFLLIMEMVRVRQSGYDKFDVSIILLSIVNISCDMLTLLVGDVAISSISLIIKVFWVFLLYCIYLKFMFNEKESQSIIYISLAALSIYIFVQIFYFHVIPIRYSILTMILLISISTIHQTYYIKKMLKNNEQDDSKRLRRRLKSKKSQNKEPLLQPQIKYEKVLLSHEIKYHLYLRRSFCITLCISQLIAYFFLWDLQESRESLGEVITIFIIEVLPIAEYYFFICWKRESAATPEEQEQQERPQSYIEMTQIKLY